MANFKTKARAVDLLGEKQIKDEATAITELFKNAHDADASQAVIDIYTDSDTLTIWDDGHGMTPEDVDLRWLTLGTDSKLAGPQGGAKRSKGGRVMMGEKGIGRLAIAMLGRQMLMITKSADNPYVLTYIHWDIFTNGDLLLEDTIIPVREAPDLSGLTSVLEDMKFEQKSNIFSENQRVIAAWEGQYATLSERILRDISAFQINQDIMTQALDHITESGTLFYVANLKEKNWRVFANPANMGVRLRNKKQNLQIMMSSFLNVLQMFEGQTLDTHLEDVASFTPGLLIDGQHILSPEHFEPEDLKRYDYGLVGRIANGSFNGTALVQGQTPEQVSVPVTAGLADSDLTDCGPLDIRVYFVEGLASNSHLDASTHRIINEKLDNIGGIYVYRDGLRVLPYGASDADFLEFERRRTLNFRYLLSMRRMFGYIAITKELNPGLEDKTSREGLRENDEYEYFRRALINLMIWWGRDYLDKQGRRDAAVTQNKSRKDADELGKKRQKERDAFLRQLQAATNAGLDIIQRAAAGLGDKIRSRIPTPNKLGFEVMLRPRERNQSYFELWEMLDHLEETRGQLLKEIVSLGVSVSLPFDTRFMEDDEVIAIRRSYANAVQGHRDPLSEMLNQHAAASHEFLQGQLQRYLDHVSAELHTPSAVGFLQGLRDAVRRSGESIQAARSQATNLLRSAVERKATRYNTQVDELQARIAAKQQAVVNEYDTHLDRIFTGLEHELVTVQTLLDRFTALDADGDLRLLASEIQTRTTKLAEQLVDAQRTADEQIQHAVANVAVPSLDVLDTAASDETFAEERRFVNLLEGRLQELTSQMEEYRGLVSTGLAAEIVNHEFNQSYEAIHNILAKPDVATMIGRSSDLQQLQHLFKHLEQRHRLLSPLYRRTRLYRSTLRLRDLGERMREIFGPQIELYNIQFRNEIEPDFFVYESEPILYPVFINILNNAMYWMLDRPRKVILLRSDRTNNAFYLEDSGKGISSENAEKVFELFYTTRFDGRGIGLHLVRELLGSRNHRVVCVTNPAEKELTGACFRVDFDRSTIVDGGSNS